MAQEKQNKEFRHKSWLPAGLNARSAALALKLEIGDIIQLKNQ